MTEPEQPSTEVAIRNAGELTEGDQWIAVMPHMSKLAQMIANTEFVPKGLRGKPAAVAAALLSGRELGIGPMTAMQHMNIIDGRPGMSAELKRARALASGHEIVYEEMSTQRCVIKGRRKGSEHWTTVTWTMEDARNAKLVGKDNWRLYPRRMLQARATGELCDLVFPDCTAGLPTIEELEDDNPEYTASTTGEVVTDKTRRTVQRKSAVGKKAKATNTKPAADPAPETPEPPLPGEDGIVDAEIVTEPEAGKRFREEMRQSHVDAVQPEDVPPRSDAPERRITDPMLKKLHAIFTRMDWQRADRMDALTAIVGHSVGSSSELSFEEGKAVIDTLERISANVDPEVASERLGKLIVETMGSETRAVVQTFREHGFDEAAVAELPEPGDPWGNKLLNAANPKELISVWRDATRDYAGRDEGIPEDLSKTFNDRMRQLKEGN